MALLLTQDDLRPMVDDPAQIRVAIHAIEEATLAQARGDAGHATYLQFPLMGGPGMDVYSTSGPVGATVRIFPQRVGGSLADGHVMLLLDEADGHLLALLSGDDLNALRTSLPAAVGAKHLTPAGAKQLCILGSGQQAAGHLRCLSAAIDGLTDIRIYSPTAANRESFARDWTQRLGREVRACASAEEAIRDADIVAATAHVTDEKDQPKAEWVKPGAVVTSLVSAPPMTGLNARLVFPSFKRPQTVFPRMMRPADSPPPALRPHAELAAIMRGEAKAREHDKDIVLYSIAAPYSWDAPVMRWAYDWAMAKGVGTRFGLSAS
jgi:alanine dehydrogenase